MSHKFPAVDYKAMAKILLKKGFYFYRQAKGSHEIWRRDADGRQTTIPNHGSKILKRQTAKAIFKDAGISVKEFGT